MAIRSSIPAEDAANTLSKAMSEWLNDLKPQDLFITCVSCLHLKDDRFCNVHKANPPASVIIQGCPKYEDATEIPF